MTNPFLKRLAAQGTTEHGRKSETRIAKSLKARLMPASGSQVGAKGDMRLQSLKRRWRIESKSTINKSLNVELGWLEKIAHEARGAGDVPALTISFVTSEGKPRSDKNAEWVCIPKWLFSELIEE